MNRADKVASGKYECQWPNSKMACLLPEWFYGGKGRWIDIQLRVIAEPQIGRDCIAFIPNDKLVEDMFLLSR